MTVRPIERFPRQSVPTAPPRQADVDFPLAVSRDPAPRWRIGRFGVAAALLIGAIATWAGNPRTPQDAAPARQEAAADEAEIRNLILKLGADAIKERDQAMGRLKRHVAGRISIIRRELANVTDPAILLAVNQVCLQAIEESSRFTSDVRITLNLKDATIREGMEAFQKQLPGCKLAVDFGGWPEDYRIDEFVVDRKPWREALEAFLGKSEGWLEEETVDTIRISQPPRVTLMFEDGDIRTIIKLIRSMSMADIVVSGEVRGTATIRILDQPWPVALNTVAVAGNLVVLRGRSGVCRVLPADQVKLETRKMSLKTLAGPTPKLWSALRSASTRCAGNPLGRLLYNVAANEISIIDQAPVLDEMVRLIREADASK